MAASARPSPVVLGLVAVGIAVGAAATLVATSTRPYSLPSGEGAGYSLPIWVLGALLLTPFIAGFAAVLYQRFRTGAARPPGTVVAVAAIFGVFLLFLFLLSIAAHGNLLPSTSSSGSGGSGSTGNGSGSTGGTGPGSGGGIFPTESSSFAFSHGLVLLLGVVIILVVAAVLVPGLLRRARDRRAGAAAEAAAPAAVDAASHAFQVADADLDHGTDPRTVIERLYTGLLARVGPATGDLAALTPEEIRAERLVRLGVRAPAAHALTRLFEEARYSSHPMGPDAADRVRAAIGDARTDLARRTAVR